MKNGLIVLTTRLLVVVLTPLPRRVLQALGRALGLMAYVVLPSSRRIADENLARAFPGASGPERRALARLAYVTLGGLLGDTMSRLSPRARPTPLPFDSAESEAVLEAARATGRGVMLLSAHLGPYEDVARSLLLHGVPLLAVTKAAYDPRLDFVFERLREGLPTVARDEAGAAMRMVRHLRRGDVLGVPMDLASRVPSVSAPFFGVPAQTPVGPARIALRTGAAIVVCTAVRAKTQKGQPLAYAMRVTPVTTDELERPDATPEQVLTARINDELCERIRGLPEAWPWMHPRFRGDAKGSKQTGTEALPPETFRVSGLPVEETR